MREVSKFGSHFAAWQACNPRLQKRSFPHFLHNLDEVVGLEQSHLKGGLAGTVSEMVSAKVLSSLLRCFYNVSTTETSLLFFPLLQSILVLREVQCSDLLDLWKDGS